MDNRQAKQEIEQDGKRYILAMTRPRSLATFWQQFGYMPRLVFQSGRLWLAGPVPRKVHSA